MPIYCYKCSKCEKEFEVVQKITEDSYIKHNEAEKTECDGEIKRVIQPVNWSLKGAGWTNKFFRTGQKRGK